MLKLERAKKELHLTKLKTIIQEKEFKILEREADIERIRMEMNDYLENIKQIEKELQGE